MEKQLLSLGSSMQDLEEAIIAEEDIDKLKDEVDLFNIHLQKKNIIRTSKLVTLQDHLLSNIQDRIQQHPELFSNQELLNYFKVIHDTTVNMDNTFDKIHIPSICVTQNQFNINVSEGNVLNRESRRKILDAISMIVNKTDQEDDIIDGETINSIEEIKNDDSREISTTNK